MKVLARYIIWGSLLLPLMVAQAKGQVRVQAQVDQSRPIYAGSRFTYRIIVADGSQPERVDLAPLKNYSPSNPSTESRTSVMNGRTSSFQIRSYQLLAPAKGELTIPSVQVTVDGKAYQTNPVTISVVEPGSTKQIDVDVRLSSQTCYVGQPIVMTLSFYVWTDIVRQEQMTNLDIQVPFLEDGNFYQEEVDSQFNNTTQTVLPVNGHNAYVYQDQITHDGVSCIRVRFAKVLIPKKAGSFDLKPASVTADIAVGQKNQGRSRFGSFFGPQYEYQRFGVQSDPLKLHVQVLPQAGRPDDFYGLVGNYTISADAEPKDVNVGDPITLTIYISGSQYLKPVQWPAVDEIPLMSDSFKIPSERSDGQILNNAKVFTQTIRPNHADVKEVPPIPLSFFDVNTKQYRTIYSKPIPLQVSPTRIVTGGDVESRQLPTSRKQIEAVREGLSANYTSYDALVNQHFSPLVAITSPIFIFLYAIPLIGLIGSVITRIILSDSPQRQAANKRKKAYSTAVKLIRHALNHQNPSQQALIALKQYVADKFGKPAGSLTAMDCGNVIFEKTNDTELSALYQEIMAQTEASEYSPMAFKLTNEKQKEIVELLTRIEKKI